MPGQTFTFEVCRVSNSAIFELPSFFTTLRDVQVVSPHARSACTKRKTCYLVYDTTAMIHCPVYDNNQMGRLPIKGIGSIFVIEGPGKKKKHKFPRLVKAFLIRVAESYRIFYIFLSREVPSAATPPRALQ